jgi:hypothetical protein
VSISASRESVLKAYFYVTEEEKRQLAEPIHRPVEMLDRPDRGLGLYSVDPLTRYWEKA